MAALGMLPNLPAPQEAAEACETFDYSTVRVDKLGGRGAPPTCHQKLSRSTCCATTSDQPDSLAA